MATAAVALAVVMWGLVPVANRFMVSQFDPLAVLALRFALSGLAFLAILIQGRHAGWTRADLRDGLLCSVVGILGYNLPASIGQQWTTAGTAGLILASEPLWILLIWAGRERRRPGPAALLGALLGLIGVGLLLSHRGDAAVGRHPVLGAALILIGAVAWSFYCVLMREFAQRRGSMQATAFTVVLGAIPLIALGGRGGVALAVQFAAVDWAVLIALAIGSTVVGGSLWNYGIARLPAPRVGPFLYVVPLVSVIGGVAFLHEPVDWRMLAGGAIVLTGVLVAQGGPALRFARRLLPWRLRPEA